MKKRSADAPQYSREQGRWQTKADSRREKERSDSDKGKERNNKINNFRECAPFVVFRLNFFFVLFHFSHFAFF